MKTAKEYKILAKSNLKGNWKKSICVCLIITIVSSLISIIPVLGMVFSLLFASQFIVSGYNFFLKTNNNNSPRVSSIFDNFGQQWANNFVVYILQSIYTVLWSILFIIPGIIKSYAYSMSLFLKAKDPKMTSKEAINLSIKMMDGNKLKLFYLQISFCGWIILSYLTLGIGFIFLEPYMKSATTSFYEDIYCGYYRKKH